MLRRGALPPLRAARKRTIRDDSSERSAKSFDVAGLDENPTFVVCDDVGQSTDPRGDHRATHAHRLEGHESERFVHQRGNNRDGATPKGVEDDLVRLHSDSAHVVGQEIGFHDASDQDERRRINHLSVGFHQHANAFVA